jgi:hypothetical protein
MWQKDGEKWTAAADSQPTISMSYRLLGHSSTVLQMWKGINSLNISKPMTFLQSWYSYGWAAQQGRAKLGLLSPTPSPPTP